jgi:hypothetical protein
MPDLSERYRLLTKVPAPDLWPEIELRTPGPGRERAPRRLVAAGIAMAVAAAATGFAVYSFGFGHERPPPISTPSPTPNVLTARVTASIPIGPRGQVPSVAYGAGSVWVAYYDASPAQHGHLVRVDPATNRVVDDVVVDTFPSWEVGGGGLTVADGSVWITGSIESTRCPNPSGRRSQAALVQVDAATDTPIKTICLGGQFGADVAVDDAGVWVLVFSYGGPMEVVRVDPSTGDVLGRTQLQQRYGHYLFAVAGSIVAGVNEVSGPDVGDSVLAVIDPATGALRDTIPLHAYAWLASDGEQLWAATGDGLERLDPATGAVTAGPYAVATTGDALAVGADGVSYLSPEGRRLFVMRLDPATGRTTQIGVRGRFEWNALAMAPGTLWGLGFDGTLYRVDLPR